SLAALSLVGADGILTFSTTTPLIDSLVPGDIVVAGISSKTPYGLLRKVQSMSKNGASVVVNTTRANIEEAIPDGRVTASARLTPADIASSQPLGKGVVRMQAQDAAENQGIIFGFDDVEIYSDDHSRVTVSGSLSITPQFDFDLSLSGGGVDAISFGFGAG